MKTMYTKGNWICTKYNNDDFGVYSDAGDGRDIALVRSCKSEEETEANAKLIESAPELLATLIELFNLLEENEPQWYLRGHYNRTIRAIQKAIGNPA